MIARNYCHTWVSNPQLTETLIAMRSAGHSFSEIGRALGMSRNACIGRAKRIGLSQVNIARRALPKRDIAPPKEKPKPIPVVQESRHTPLLETSHNVCRFPMWNDQDKPSQIVCGADGHPWCDFHRSVVFQKKSESA